MKKLLLAATLISTAALGASAADGFYTKGTKLYDAKDNEFIMRGVNYAWVWQQGNENSVIPAAKQIGCNTVRLAVRFNDGRRADASKLRSLIKLCRDNKLAVVLEDHAVTGSTSTSDLMACVNYWKEMTSVLNDNLDIVIVNIANEWYGPWNQAQAWADGYIQAIKAMRDAGIKNTLMVDAAGYGQWPASVNQKGKDVAAADKLHNIMFSTHIYDDAGKDESTTRQSIDYTLAPGVPAVIGEFAYKHKGRNVCYQTVMDYCQQKGIGYLVWSWTGNSSEVADCDMFADYTANNYKQNGTLTVKGKNGIQATSKELSVFNSTPSGDNTGGNTGDNTGEGGIKDTYTPASPKAFGNWNAEINIPASFFAKAKAGDTVRMTFSDCGTNPQVQIVAKIGSLWTWTEVVPYADIANNNYEYVLPESYESQDIVSIFAERGMILKGQNATLTKAELISNGSDTPDNTNEIGSWAPESSIDFNGWNKEILIPGSTFAKASLGDVVRLQFTECGATPQVQVIVKLGEGWTWTELVKSADIVAEVSEYTIAELAEKKATRAGNDVNTVLGALKEHGMVLKGQQAKLTKVSVVTTATPSGVDGVEIEDAEAPVEIYNLQGVRVNEMTKGIYIVRQGNKVTKVIK